MADGVTVGREPLMCARCGVGAHEGTFCETCGGILVLRSEREKELRDRNKKRNYRKNISSRKRQRIFDRDEHRCQSCGTERELTVDHDVPVARGGTNADRNLVLLCHNCNQDKGDQTWTEWKGARRRVPRRRR